jgi:hypothetical protein
MQKYEGLGPASDSDTSLKVPASRLRSKMKNPCFVPSVYVPVKSLIVPSDNEDDDIRISKIEQITKIVFFILRIL